MLNLHWLNTFKTLVEVGHFTKTAKTLFMTQPGVSQHIKKLEAQLGTNLLVKNGKQFELTEAGKQVYQYAIKQQNEEEALREAIKVDSPYAGECRFAMSGSLCMQFNSLFLKRQIAHRELTLFLEAAPNSRIIESVADNSIDLGIVTQKTPSKSLFYQQVGEEKLCLVVPNSFQKEDWNFDDLQRLGIIDHPDCQHYLRQYLSAYQIDSTSPHIPLSGYINQLGQILYPVAKGLGFTILPIGAVNAFPQQEYIRILETDKSIQETLYLVYKQHKPLPIRYQWFIDTICSTLCD